MFLIDTQNKKATPLIKQSFSELNLTERNDLQEWIVNHPQILGENLLIIQKEFAGFSDTNERLDLLALDEVGRLVVIENKLDDSGRDVVWQALKYVSYCAALSKSQICDIFQSYLGNSGVASDVISDFYDGQDYESINLNHGESSQRIIMVSAKFRKEVTSAVLWLRNLGADITCIKTNLYKDGEKLLLDTEQIIPIRDAQDYQIGLTAKKQEETTTSKQEAIRHKLRRSFWEKALPVLRERTKIYNNWTPSDDSWIWGASGHSGIGFNSIIKKNGARAEIFIRIANNPEKTKQIFNALKSQLGESGIWEWNENPKTCNIGINFNKYGLADEDNWGEIIDFLADNIVRLMKTFKPFLDEIRRGSDEI